MGFQASGPCFVHHILTPIYLFGRLFSCLQLDYCRPRGHHGGQGGSAAREHKENVPSAHQTVLGKRLAIARLFCWCYYVPCVLSNISFILHVRVCVCVCR